MEKLYELHDRGGFDLIVVDTPPTRHALDFLDAPRRLTRMLDNRVFRILMVPTRTTLRVGSVAAQALLAHHLTRRRHRTGRRRRVVLPRLRGHGGGVPGPGAAGDAAARRRRDRVRARDVAAARRGRGGRVLRASDWPTVEYAVDALVVNRVHPRYSDHATRTRLRAPRRRARRSRTATRPARLAARYANLADFEEVARPRTRGARRPRNSASATLRSPTCPSWGTTCTTSPRSGRSGATCWAPTRFPAVSTIVVAADAQVGPRPREVGVHRAGAAGDRGHPRPGRARRRRRRTTPISSSSTCRSPTWAGSRSPSTCASRARRADPRRVDPAAARPRGRPLPRQAGRRRRRAGEAGRPRHAAAHRRRASWLERSKRSTANMAVPFGM